MKRICIGIYLHAEPLRLQATLRSVRAHTAVDFDLLLLPDGPDEPTQAFLGQLSDAPQSATTEPRGTAACFNRLTASSDAEIFVLLESGALVSPQWLEHLLRALDADPRNGLAGPTTNYSWNEQCFFHQARETPEDIARVALDAHAIFGDETRSLEPLYSLSDFCYVVRREVIEAIGAAEEGYQLGPCWEMDYNIRAARAGFRGVWACASYVHRAPFTARRYNEETLRFEASKRLYQDKFCGARLRGQKTDYRAHCSGDACPNFAPPELLLNKQALPMREPEALPAVVAVSLATMHAPAALPLAAPVELSPAPVELSIVAPVVEQEARAGFVETNAPLVSCIMPTYNRRHFLPLAIRCFMRQDYPNLELIIVDDGTDAVANCVPEDARVRYLRLNERLTIGAKRNVACEQARGDFIVHWDDDDWSPSWRVSAQVKALIERGADISGTSRLFYYEAATDRAWEYRFAADGVSWVGGNTMAYRKEFWKLNRFPEVQVGEDTLFMHNEVSKTIFDLDTPELCVATVHDGNTSYKETTGMFWHRRESADVRALLGDDLHLSLSQFAPAQAPAWPLVSCIMPTYNRQPFLPIALSNFMAQDYPNKELIIVDDSDTPVDHLVNGLPGVRYIYLGRRESIGAKRNLACQMAQGSIIAHWDDDDWYAPERLRYQARPILAGEADLSGLSNAFVLELSKGIFWTVNAHLHRRMFVGNVHGGTLVYRKSLLEQGLRYPEINLAEDAWLLYEATNQGRRLLELPNQGVYVYMRHGSNAWSECTPGSFIDPSGWQRVSAPHTFRSAHLHAYQTAAAQLHEKSRSRF
ncbi:MAG TPA: glycosyltransferase [Pyrinomonadaceae bacterium]